jgi:hypothetical protein
MVNAIIQANVIREQGFRSARGLQRIGERYGAERTEAACGRAVGFGARSYKPVERILRLGRETTTIRELRQMTILGSATRTCGTGRRAGLKIRCPQGRVGSSPTLATKLGITRFCKEESRVAVGGRRRAQRVPTAAMDLGLGSRAHCVSSNLVIRGID